MACGFNSGCRSIATKVLVQLLVAIACLDLTGCNSARVYQVEPGTELYVVHMNPDEAFSFVERQFRGNLEVKVPKGSLGGDFEATNTLFAEKLDQLNSQLRGQYSAAFFALNANPTSQENQNRYWDAFDELRKDAKTLRKIVLAEAERREELREGRRAEAAEARAKTAIATIQDTLSEDVQTAVRNAQAAIASDDPETIKSAVNQLNMLLGDSTRREQKVLEEFNQHLLTASVHHDNRRAAQRHALELIKEARALEEQRE